MSDETVRLESWYALEWKTSQGDWIPCPGQWEREDRCREEARLRKLARKFDYRVVRVTKRIEVLP